MLPFHTPHAATTLLQLSFLCVQPLFFHLCMLLYFLYPFRSITHRSFILAIRNHQLLPLATVSTLSSLFLCVLLLFYLHDLHYLQTLRSILSPSRRPPFPRVLPAPSTVFLHTFMQLPHHLCISFKDLIFAPPHSHCYSLFFLFLFIHSFYPRFLCSSKLKPTNPTLPFLSIHAAFSLQPTVSFSHPRSLNPHHLQKTRVFLLPSSSDLHNTTANTIQFSFSFFFYFTFTFMNACLLD